MLKLTASERKQRPLIIQALQRKFAGPLLGGTDNELFRMVVGTFFGPFSIDEYQAYVEKLADKIILKARKKRRRHA